MNLVAPRYLSGGSTNSRGGGGGGQDATNTGIPLSNGRRLFPTQHINQHLSLPPPSLPIVRSSLRETLATFREHHNYCEGRRRSGVAFEARLELERTEFLSRKYTETISRQDQGSTSCGSLIHNNNNNSTNTSPHTTTSKRGGGGGGNNESTYNSNNNNTTTQSSLLPIPSLVSTTTATAQNKSSTTSTGHQIGDNKEVVPVATMVSDCIYMYNNGTSLYNGHRYYH